jgi:outer membrane protein TolC
MTQSKVRSIFACLGLGVMVPASDGVAGTATEMSLEDAVRRARESHPDAQIAQLRMVAALAALDQANAAFRPRVRLHSGYVGTNQPVSVFGMALNQRAISPSLNFNDVPTADNWTAGASVSLPLYAGGALRAGREAAVAAAAARGHEATGVQRTLESEVTRTWLTVYKARSFTEAARAEAESFASHLALTRKRLAAGSALKTDVLDMEVRLAQAREDLARSANAHALNRRALASLLGLENSEIEAQRTIPVLAVPQPAESPRRPELLAAESMVRAAVARVKSAAAGRKPSVRAFGAAEHNRGSRFDGEGSSFTVGVMAEWDAWDGGQRKGSIAAAEAAARIAEAELRRQSLAVDLELQQARLALSEADERLSVSAQSVSLAAESVRLLRERFAGGLALATQLIDAETALTAARMRRSEAETDRCMAIAALRRALGLPLLPSSTK